MNEPDHPPEAGISITRSPVDGARSVTLGEILRQARERQALTIDEVARRTRLPKRHLEALERNNLAGLPPGIYQRAEVRAYANAVGLDPQLALVALGRAQAASAAAAEARAPQPVSAPAPQTRGHLPLGLIAVIAMALLIGGASAFWRRQASEPVSVRPTAVEEKVVPTSLRLGPAGEPQSGGVTDAAAPTPTSTPTQTPASLPDDSTLAPKVFAYPDLLVITEPAGARVTVDGVGWGQSPLTIRALSPGSRLVRVTLDGYAAQERRIAVASDTPRTTVRITLKPVK